MGKDTVTLFVQTLIVSYMCESLYSPLRTVELLVIGYLNCQC